MRRALTLLLLAVPGIAFSKWTPCASWPVNMTEVYLQNAGIVKIDQLDESKTKAIPIAYQKIGKDLYRQVFDITLYAKSGQSFHVVTVSSASSTECSISDVTTYLVSRKLTAEAPPP